MELQLQSSPAKRRASILTGLDEKTAFLDLPYSLKQPSSRFLNIEFCGIYQQSISDFWVSVGLVKLLLFWTGSSSRSRKEEGVGGNPKQLNVSKANPSWNEFFPSKTVAFQFSNPRERSGLQTMAWLSQHFLPAVPFQEKVPPGSICP